MSSPKQDVWIQAGYKTFAHEGPNSLKIEAIARQVGKSKSSFYHHFADLEVFTEILLTYHLEQATAITTQAAQCQNMVPDFLNMLLGVKDDILFNRQLRIHRHNPTFKACFEKAHTPLEAAFLEVWGEYLGLTDQGHVAKMLLSLTVENFYLKITPDNLNKDWLVAYLGEIQLMVNAMRRKL